MSVRSKALSAIPVLVACLAGCPAAEPEPIEASLSAVVLPGEHVAVAIDLAEGTTDLYDSSPELSADALAAISAAPAWLRDALRVRLGMLDLESQDTLAALVLAAEGGPLVDEIAFSIANMTENDLSSDDFDPQVVAENAAAIYEFDELLPYAELIEVGDGASGPRTTVRYQVTDAGGTPSTSDLDPSDYYWWVVHPRLDYEATVPVDPGTGEPAGAPLGVHWRRYLVESSEQTFDYRDHYMMRVPDDLRLAELAMAASAHLSDPAIWPIRLFVDENGNGLLYEIDHAAGTILASTLDYAWRQHDGETSLLQNVTDYGNTNVLLNLFHDVALVIDSEPWGGNPYLDVATAEIHQMTSAELAGADLSIFDKVIVAADQDRAFYEAVAAQTPLLDAFAADWGVLQLDLHTAADLSGLVFAGGVAVEGGPPEAVIYEGQPLLRDVIAGTPLLWDGVDVPGDSGDRPPPQGTNAMDSIGWWATQNMYDNVSERAQVTGGNPERSWYPQRIVHNHFGNCGELGDLLAGSGRACLLAVRVIGSVEDHCWDEVRLGEAWIPWQVDWSDGATRINNPGVGSDEDLGGGKTLSGITTLRGDGYPYSSIDVYSDWVTLRMTVTDGRGTPLDGATVVLATEAFYDPQSLSLAGVAYTGPDGVATITAGDQRNYWYWVWSDAAGGLDSDGDNDPETLSVDVWATAGETAAGATIDEEVELDGEVELPGLEDVASSGDGAVDVSGSVSRAWIAGDGYYTGGRFLLDEDSGSPVRWYLLDDAQYARLREGEPFDALAAEEDARNLDASDVAVPEGGLLWLVGFNASVSTIAKVDLSLQEVPTE